MKLDGREIATTTTTAKTTTKRSFHSVENRTENTAKGTGVYWIARNQKSRWDCDTKKQARILLDYHLDDTIPTMLTLCQNREEGFVSPDLPNSHLHKLTNSQGPSSSISSIPTTCFIDTIIVPLPVWLYLLALPAAYLLTNRLHAAIFNPSHHASPARRSCMRLSTSVLYYFLVIAQILMLTLEIVRLALINRSPDLLPFQYVALALGAFLHFTNGAWGRVREAYWRGANVFVWVGLLAVTCVKVAGLGMMMDMGDVKKGFERKESKYPLSDQVIDLAVMAGLYAVLAVLEGVLGVWKKGPQRARKAESAVTDEETIVDENSTGSAKVGWAK